MGEVTGGSAARARRRLDVLTRRLKRRGVVAGWDGDGNVHIDWPAGARLPYTVAEAKPTEFSFSEPVSLYEWRLATLTYRLECRGIRVAWVRDADLMLGLPAGNDLPHQPEAPSSPPRPAMDKRAPSSFDGPYVAYVMECCGRMQERHGIDIDSPKAGEYVVRVERSFSTRVDALRFAERLAESGALSPK